jgi:hypothetical protein
MAMMGGEGCGLAALVLGLGGGMRRWGVSCGAGGGGFGLVPSRRSSRGRVLGFGVGCVRGCGQGFGCCEGQRGLVWVCGQGRAWDRA